MKEFVPKLYVTDPVGGSLQVPDVRFPAGGNWNFTLHKAALRTGDSLSGFGGIHRPIRPGETACRHALFAEG